MTLQLSAERLRELFRRMLLIRRFEELTMEMREEYPGHYHVYIGQEATAVGVCAALSDQDQLVTTHRNHGHNLARGLDPRRAMAEILGKGTGYCGGKGGTFHIMDASLGVMSASGVVAGSIPTAVGLALAAKLQRSGRVAVAFFGDGALNEGAFHEAANLAGLWRVPVIFVCEFNEAWPTYDTKNAAMAVPELVQLARSYNLNGVAVDGRDLHAVHQAAAEAVERARAGGGGTLIESRTQWYPGYQGRWARLLPGATDLRHAWEPPADQYAEWRQNDPVLRLVRRLDEEGVLGRDEALVLDGQVTAEIAETRAFARNSPWPAPATVYQDVFA